MTPVSTAISCVREQIEALDRQREALEQERVRLLGALAVLEGPFEGSPAPTPAPAPAPTPDQGVDRSSESEERPALVAQILEAFRRYGPLRRAQLQKVFAGTGVNPSTLDSAVHRMKGRGLLAKHGETFSVVDPQPAPPGSVVHPASPPASVPSPLAPGAGDLAPDPSDAAVPLVAVGIGAEEAPDPPDSSLDRAPPGGTGERILEALAAGVEGTRRALIQYFKDDFSEDAVDDALRRLFKHGRLERPRRGAWVLSRRDASPPPGGPASQGQES